MEGERAAWVLNRGQHLDGLNQHKVFLDIATGYINTDIFWDNINSEIGIRVILRTMFMSNGFSGATTLTQITLKFTILLMQRDRDRRETNDGDRDTDR